MLDVFSVESLASLAEKNPEAYGIEGCKRTGGDLPGNYIRARAELLDWHLNPPDSYFLYIRENLEPPPSFPYEKSLGVATTWMGDKLGNVRFGHRWRDNFGGERQAITVYGTNGRHYHGTYYRSSGDYARIRAYKA